MVRPLPTTVTHTCKICLRGQTLFFTEMVFAGGSDDALTFAKLTGELVIVSLEHYVVVSARVQPEPQNGSSVGSSHWHVEKGKAT